MNLGRLWCFTIFALLIPQLALAYPIFLKCNKDRELTDVVTDEELNKLLRAFVDRASGDETRVLSDLCGGLKNCIQDLENLLAMVVPSQEVANKVLKDFLARQEFSSGFNLLTNLVSRFREPKDAEEALSRKPWIPITEAEFKTRRAMTEGEAIFHTAKELDACRKTPRLVADQFVNGDSISIFYPYHSNYLYATGCQTVNSRNLVGSDDCQSNSASVLRDAIRKSLRMGVDPYFAIAIGLMEGGVNGIERLSLDPVAQFAVMGCKTKPVKAGTEGALTSFYTYYKVDARTVEDPDLARRIERFISNESINFMSKQTRYYCRTDLSDSTGVLLKEPEGCCIKLSLPPSYNDIESALLYEFLRQTQDAACPIEGMDELAQSACRAQRFNGFSNLMGAAESVPAWRSGVNYYRDPVYGYQTMDYILNSLVTNPAIRQMVEDEKKRQGVKVKSVLCLDRKAPGVFAIDSDEYFERHGAATRMDILKEAFDAGKRWDEMPDRMRKVMIWELFNVGLVDVSKMGDLSTSFVPEHVPDHVLTDYFEKHYPKGQTLKQTSDYRWERLTVEEARKIGRRLRR